MTELTKWPLLLVSGVQVTPEQANEILIRTCVPSYLSANDREWEEIISRILRMPLRHNWHDIPELRDDSKARMTWLREQIAQVDARAEELGIIGLEYLYNSRISTASLGGPHGWCDWSGNIFTDSYNIGKWPEAVEITDEWSQIAEAFPFLDLTAQLVNEDETGAELAGEWRVKEGAVTYNPDPTEQIRRETDQEEFIESAVADLFSYARERGVSPERLMLAVAQVEASRRGKV